MSRNPILVQNANRPSLVKAEGTLVDGLAAVLGKASLPVNGTSMTPAQIVTLVQGHLDAIAMLDNLHGQLQLAVKAERAQRATVKAAVLGVRNYVACAFGEDSPQFAALGFSARKRAQKSVQCVVPGMIDEASSSSIA